jgi:hypothetical protein
MKRQMRFSADDRPRLRDAGLVDRLRRTLLRSLSWPRIFLFPSSPLPLFSFHPK